MTTTQERLAAALATTRSAGVQTALNVKTCCRSCTTLRDIGVNEKDPGPYVWHFGGQDLEIVWLDGEPFHIEPRYLCNCDDDESCRSCQFGGGVEYREKEVRTTYFQHGGEGAAAALRDALKAQGFDVEWDGTNAQAVVLNFV